LPELNWQNGLASTPEEKVEVLRYKFFSTPPEPNMKNTVGFQYSPEKQTV